MSARNSVTPTRRVASIARDMGAVVLSRKAWGSKPATNPWPLAVAQAGNNPDVYGWRRAHKPHHQIPQHPTDTLVQHITDTTPSRDFAADCRLVERIGFERFGSGVSYNWLVNMGTGVIAVGQPLDAKGTHTVNEAGVSGFSYDLNYVSVAVAVVGTPSTPLTGAARIGLARIIGAMMAAGYLNTTADYKPHRLFNPAKSCPGDITVAAMPEVWRRAVAYADAYKGRTH